MLYIIFPGMRLISADRVRAVSIGPLAAARRTVIVNKRVSRAIVRRTE